MSTTAASVSLASHVDSPRFSRSGLVLDPFLSIEAIRPFLDASSEFSLGVPRNRWSGLQHGGLSHVWQTKSPSGIGPLSNSHINLWDSLYDVRPKQTRPYPVLIFFPVQIQQPDADLCILDQNLDSWTLFMRGRVPMVEGEDNR